MDRKLIIDGNAVYELDEKCMLKKQLNTSEKKDKHERQESDGHKMKRTE